MRKFLYISIIVLLIGCSSNQEQTQSNTEVKKRTHLIFMDSTLTEKIRQDLNLDKMQELPDYIPVKVSTAKETAAIGVKLEAYFHLKDALYKENLEAYNLNRRNTVLTKKEKSLPTLEEAKYDFSDLSDSLIIQILNSAYQAKKVYLMHCPASNDGEGANWIADSKAIENPYMGIQGEGCGVFLGELSQANKEVFTVYKN